MRSIFFCLLLCAGLVACSQTRRTTNGQLVVADNSALISKAQQIFINDTALAGAHVGISIYDPAANHYLYNYQGDKYFVPASNTKLFTCYAAMKYLGDSLVGVRYRFENPELCIISSGDPTFLHPDFNRQPVLELLRQKGKEIVVAPEDKINKYGPGWGWDDYEADYMPERNGLPVYGNVIWIKKALDSSLIHNSNQLADSPFLIGNTQAYIIVQPSFFINSIDGEQPGDENFTITRLPNENHFHTTAAKGKFVRQEIPFITTDSFGKPISLQVLENIIHKPVTYSHCPYNPNKTEEEPPYSVLHSQPTDSLLKPMMHRSDNFFAEQSLLMVSNEKLGYMNDEAIIDTLLKNDLKDLPQKPVWVDGSGLSRYNLFTPQDIVTVLLKIKNEFGLERIRNILPKGNTGTLTNYYQQIGPAIFAKTGSLGGQVALSGYLTCKSGKLLLFSIMINNYTNSGRAVRRAIEKFVLQVWEKN